MIEPAENGRSVYVTSQGIVQQKLNIFFTEPELEMLRELAQDSNTPIGNLIVKLARAETHRRSAGSQ